MGEEEEKSSRMRVVVRIRPMNSRETAKNQTSIIQQLDEKVFAREIFRRIISLENKIC